MATLTELRKVGDLVTVRCPASENEPTTWTRGRIVQTIARDSSHAVHVIAVQNFKWSAGDAWGPYTGVPQEIARETFGFEELEWIDTWPRRYR